MKIRIKKSHRGRLTELKARTGKTEAELYNDGNPAHKKMVVFARNARKWHELGGNLFGGEENHSQQMQLGPRYWADQTIYHDWQNSTIDGGTLPEVIVSPTNDASWLFSDGRFKHNSRKPLADKYTRKVVSNYLSKFDSESAEDYNARISRLADVLDIRGVQFKKNDVKSGKLKGRAHYIDNSGIAYIDDMNDIFAEVAHPWQYAKGNNNIEEEVGVGTYDSDNDPRGGTRYAYPDTAEGETHGFFEPALKEWVESGKISRSLPILNKELSKQKIIPKNRMEVADSAVSWNRQAIDRRVISMPSQLPLWKRIKYNFTDFPLLKKHGLGGNLFDGESQSSQQMEIGRPFWQSQAPQPSFFNLDFPVNGGSLREVVVTGDKTKSRQRLQQVLDQRQSDYLTASNDNIWIDSNLTHRSKNPHLSRRAEEGAKAHAAWEKEHPVLNTIGTALGAAPFAVTTYPFMAVAGEAAAPVLTNPYVDAALTSYFGAHGLNHAINEGINGWGDAAMTALELVPLGRLAKPVYEGVVQPGMKLFNSPLTGNWTKIGNREYRLSPNSLGANGSPLESRAVAPQITAENAASMTPEQWTAAQDAAIARGDMAEAQRLRDLHFKVSAPDTQIVDKNGNPIHSYHGTGTRFNEFDTTGKYSTLDEGYYGKGAYFAPNKELAQMYADTEKTPIIYDTYLNIKNPLRHVRDENADLYGKVITDNDGVISTLPDDLVDETFDMTEYVATKPNQIKSADAVTFDDNGVRIPLGLRDNFNINDIRYGLIPFGIGLTGYGLLPGK